MRIRLPRYSWVLRGASALLVGTLFLALSASAAWAWPNCRSDPRATAAYGQGSQVLLGPWLPWRHTGRVELGRQCR